MTKDAQHPLTELIAIAAKAGIGLVPGGGLLTASYEALQVLSKEAAAQMERRSQKRYEEFIRSVFEAEVTPDLTEYLTADDYTALLSGCMADMENEKARYYGRLAATIGRGEVQGSSRRFLIITLSQLSHQQVQMLRQSYVAARYDLKPGQGSGRVDQVAVLNLSDPVQKHEYAELLARSMYSENELTTLGEMLVRACFDGAELTPSAIGYRAWFSKYVDIIYDSDQLSLVDSLINGFWDEGMRTVNRAVTIIDRQPMAVFANPRIMIVGSEAMPEYLPSLKARLRKADFLFVCLHDHTEHIRAHYPDSTILNFPGRGVTDITVSVIKHVRMVNGLT